MKKQLKKIPQFKTEDKEREFWATHDTTDYFDYSRPLDIEFVNLKPSTRSVTIRLPESLVYNLKVLANKRDVPYQSILKMFVAEKVEEAIGTRVKV